MNGKLIDSGYERTFAVIFDTGDEVISGLVAFANEHHLGGSHFTAIGALSSATLGYFEWEQKTYTHIPVDEQVEVLALIGDIALEDGETRVHAHVVVGKADGTAHGGHLLEAHVRPTLEVVIVEAPTYLQRTYDPETGLSLIDLQARG